MRRALLLALSLAAITCAEFVIFPGHTYLQGSTQLYVPMLERLDAPGYLSRDLVATHPNLTYTIYDEVTLFLHEAGRLDFETALTAQQLVFRAAAIIGVYLLVRSAGFGSLWALLISALVNAGAFLPGPDAHLVNPEPVPSAFAFALCLLAIGCLASEKPLLCVLAGGLAFLYDPPIAAVVWIVALIAFLADRHVRRLLRPALTIFLIFILLLANLAQLQPGVAESEPLFSRIPSDVAAILRARTRSAWVTSWASHEIWIYLFILICGLWAVARIWPSLNRQLRWLLLLPSLLGILSVPVSAWVLSQFGWWLIPRIKPARWLLFTVALSLVACGIAGIQATQLRRKLEAGAWFCFIIAVLVITRVTAPPPQTLSHKQAIISLGRWAESNTWGSSMFVFPDAGRDLYPGVFRAESRRALWVDWMSGAQGDYSATIARTWNERWHRDMTHVQTLQTLPIDYFVLKRSRRLPRIQPVFANRDFVVYDSRDLESITTR